MVAVFGLGCCGKEIVAGRFKGGDMAAPTTGRCPFGCEQQYLLGRVKRVTLIFKRYESEDMIDQELLETWKWRPRDGR